MGDSGQRRNSLFRGSHTAHRLQPWTVAAARRKTGRELSDSLVNGLKRVNSRVAFGTSSVFELGAGK